MNAHTETHFLTFWRELNAALASGFEAPATHYEAASLYREPLTDLDGMVSEILRYRVAAASFALMQKAA